MLCALLCTLTSVLFVVCVKCQIWLFTVVVLSCYLDQLFSESLLSWLQLPQLLLLSLLFLVHMHCTSIVRSL